MIGKDKFAHKLRQANLRHLFGDVFDYIYCAGDFRKPKSEILKERYEGKDYIWIEDRIDYALQGAEIGLKTYVMDWPYNREGWDGKRVKNWSELYDATH